MSELGEALDEFVSNQVAEVRAALALLADADADVLTLVRAEVEAEYQRAYIKQGLLKHELERRDKVAASA